jgi:hypothetical protein
MVRTARNVITERRPSHYLYLSQRGFSQVVTANTRHVDRPDY